MSIVAEIAKRLDGLEYPVRIPEEVAEQAKAAGIVIVYGASDDLMEFEGAIEDEIGAYNGVTVTVTVTEQGLVEEFDAVLASAVKERLRKYFASEGKGRVIEALWAVEGYSWTYKTDIPHATFEVVEDGDKYCRGIVFQLSDCAS